GEISSVCSLPQRIRSQGGTRIFSVLKGREGWFTPAPRQRVLLLVLIVVAAFSVRALTANFLRAHLDDPGWFPSGIYGAFDRQAQDWLAGRAAIFWLDVSSRPDNATYPAW